MGAFALEETQEELPRMFDIKAKASGALLPRLLLTHHRIVT